MKRTKTATVHNMTTERARRGRLPWSFSVDLAQGRFRITILKSAGPVDLIAMAESAEHWARTLREAAHTLRKGASDLSGPKGATHRKP